MGANGSQIWSPSRQTSFAGSMVKVRSRRRSSPSKRTLTYVLHLLQIINYFDFFVILGLLSFRHMLFLDAYQVNNVIKKIKPTYNLKQENQTNLQFGIDVVIYSRTSS